MHASARSLGVPLVTALSLAACAGDATAPARSPAPRPALAAGAAGAAAPTLALGASALVVPAGGRADLAVTVVGRGDSTTRGAPPLELSVAGLPDSARATFLPATLADSVGRSALAIDVPRQVAPGTYPLTVRAHAPGDSAANDAAASLALVVTAAQRFTVALDAPVALLRRGDSAAVSVRVTRADSSRDTLDLSVDGTPAGVTARLVRDTANADSARLTLAAAATVPNGAFDVVVRARASDGEEQSAAVRVVVVTGTASDSGVTWTPCDSGGAAVWVATRDGDAPWRRVLPTNGRFVVRTRSAESGLAVVTGSPTTGWQLTVEYGSAGALATSACVATAPIDTTPIPTPATRRVTGTLAGLTATTRGVVTMGSEQATVAYDGGGARPFTLDSVSADARFVSAARVAATPSALYIPDRLLLRRRVEGSALDPMDFASDEAFAPARPALRVFGLGKMAYTSVMLLALTPESGDVVQLYSDTLSAAHDTARYVALPPSRRAAGDMYWLTVFDAAIPDFGDLPDVSRAGASLRASALRAARRVGMPAAAARPLGARLAGAATAHAAADAFDMPMIRWLMQTFATPTDLAVDLGPAGLRPTLTTAATAPYTRYRVRWQTGGVRYSAASVTFSEYGASGAPGVPGVPGLGGHTVMISRTTSGAALPADVELELPDFTGVDGWDPAWVPAPGPLTSWVFAASDVNLAGQSPTLPGLYPGQRMRYLVTGGTIIR